MTGLTILGGGGFVGKRYVDTYYHHAIGNIASVNKRNDYSVYSSDVLYLISTVDNYNVFTNVHLDIDTNLSTLVTVLENWKKHQDTTGERGVFNFISSWSVYGNQYSPVAETAPCDPKGFYIITKRCAEQLLISYCETFKLRYRIIRLANVVGPGDNKVSEKKNTLQNAFNKLRRNEGVELFGDGLFYRDFMHVEDCVTALETVMSRGEENTIYNIGNGSTSGKVMYYRDILEYAKSLLKSTSTITFKPPTAFQASVPVSSFYMDVNKLRTLGFTPKFVGENLFKKVISEG
jgi:nucleoside-diphosphate-sugar epimerase